MRGNGRGRPQKRNPFGGQYNPAVGLPRPNSYQLQSGSSNYQYGHQPSWGTQGGRSQGQYTQQHGYGTAGNVGGSHFGSMAGSQYSTPGQQHYSQNPYQQQQHLQQPHQQHYQQQNQYQSFGHGSQWMQSGSFSSPLSSRASQGMSMNPYTTHDDKHRTRTERKRVKREATSLFRCDKCSMCFASKHELRFHKQNQHQETVHQCKLCGTTFSNKGNLNKHVSCRV